MVRPVLVATFLVLTLLAAPSTTAEAGDTTVIIKSGPEFRKLNQDLHWPKQHQFLPAPRTVFVVPSTVLIVPSPPPCRWIPGYWTYQWIPQSYTYEAWVPGHWSPQGSWFEGHYQLRAVSTGYYQPFWVDGRCIQY